MTKKPFSHNAIVNKHQEKKKKMNAHGKISGSHIRYLLWFPLPLFLFLSPRELGKVAEGGSFMFSHIERGKKSPQGISLSTSLDFLYFQEMHKRHTDSPSAIKKGTTTVT